MEKTEQKIPRFRFKPTGRRVKQQYKETSIFLAGNREQKGETERKGDFPMDFRQISYLITIAEKNCNVTKAAKSLFLSQAALSKALLAAEQELETQIFLRERGRLVGLSPAGKILIAQAKNLLSSYAEMR